MIAIKMRLLMKYVQMQLLPVLINGLPHLLMGVGNRSREAVGLLYFSYIVQI